MSPEEMLRTFPDQLEWEESDLDPSSFGRVIFCGMGGSGIVGDIAVRWMEHRGFSVPAVSYRGYGLPPWAGEGDLVVCTSYSGNTEETVSNFLTAVERGATVIAISSGGKLRELSRQHGTRHMEIPAGFAPRYALGFMLSKLLSLLNVDRDELEEARENLRASLEECAQKGEEIAQRLYGYVPVMYATPLTEVCAFRWKTQINENSKTQAYFAVLPEMHHNEVVGLDNAQIRSKCAFILMQDAEDHERVLRRVDITADLLRDLGVVPLRLSGKGNSYLSRLLHLIFTGDWASYHLALKYGFDPLPVKIIDYIKGELSKG